MFTRKIILPALALAVVLGGSAGLTTLTAPNAAAQASTAPQPTLQPERHRFDPSRHVEGRIAFLKAELKISDAQAPQFDRVAQTMRDNAKDMSQAFAQRHADRDKPQTAIERLEARAGVDAMRAQHAQRFLAAFKPLYDGLSDGQKKIADEMLAAPRHHHRR
jgi:hypothetical protein